MSSLPEKDGKATKVQMISIDPPSGIKYGSNFQPFVNECDVKYDNDEGLIEAYRGTVSLTFEPGEHKRIALESVDHRRIESVKVMEVKE